MIARCREETVQQFFEEVFDVELKGDIFSKIEQHLIAPKTL